MPNKYECVRCGDDIREEFITNDREVMNRGDGPQYDMESCNRHLETNGRLCAYCAHMLSTAD